MTGNERNKSNSKWNTIHYVYLICLGFIFYIFLLLYMTSTYTYKNDVISYLLLAALIVVFFIPLVKEIDILNIIKIKKDIEEFKNDISDKITQLQITTSMNQNRNINLVSIDQQRLVEQIIKEISETTKTREETPFHIEPISKQQHASRKVK